MNWFYESAGQQQGPVTDEDLDRLLREGQITSATLVWHEGLADWLPLLQARPEAVAGTPGTRRCGACGRFVPEEDLVAIGDRQVCPECKPSVLLALQQGLPLPYLEAEGRNGPAWEQRATLGTFPALWKTLTGVLGDPSLTFSRMRREGGLAKPFFYYWLTASTGLGIEYLFQAGQYYLLGQASSLNPRSPMLFPHFPNWGFPLIAVAIVLGVTMLTPLTVFLGSGILHLCLMLCQGAKRPFETTFRVYSYAYGSGTVLAIIPFCGGPVGAIWALVSLAIGLSRAHEISAGRAVLAIFLPLIVCCAAAIIIGMIIGGATALQNHH